MKQFIFWTGMISVVSGLSLQFPQIAQLLMPTEQAGMVMHLFGAMAVFLGVMLIFRSRNLQARGVLVAESTLKMLWQADQIGNPDSAIEQPAHC